MTESQELLIASVLCTHQEENLPMLARWFWKQDEEEVQQSHSRLILALLSQPSANPCNHE